jgi:hypothetical protein
MPQASAAEGHHLIAILAVYLTANIAATTIFMV